jgi:hypothetical protein
MANGSHNSKIPSEKQDGQEMSKTKSQRAGSGSRRPSTMDTTKHLYTSFAREENMSLCVAVPPHEDLCWNCNIQSVPTTQHNNAPD